MTDAQAPTADDAIEAMTPTPADKPRTRRPARRTSATTPAPGSQADAG